MNKIRLKTILCVVLAALMAASLIAAAIALVPLTRSEEDLPEANIDIDDENGALTVYVSGPEVEEALGGGYYVPAGAQITVIVVNETGIFSDVTVSDVSNSEPEEICSLTNDGEYDYGCVLEGIKATSSIRITANARGVTAADTGKLFSNPFTVDNADDLIALADILAGEGDNADYQCFGFGENGETYDKAAADAALQFGYFRMTSNILVNSDRFEGLGSRTVESPNGTKKGVPFQGCFDFNGYYAYINISETTFTSADFIPVDGTNGEEDISVADFGFFSYIYGEGAPGTAVAGASGTGGNPCLVRGADVRGSIAVNTLEMDASGFSGEYRIHAGGIAGSIGKSVVIAGARSQVSVSVQAQKSSLALGGLFGFCSASVDDWSEAVYEGDYGSISGVTQGAGADVFVGGLCGILQNAHANGFSNTARATSFVANADSAEKSGSAYVGGLAGIVYVGPALHDFPETAQAKDISVRRFTSTVQDSFVLSSVIDNEGGSKDNINPDDFSSASAGAVAGGLVGGIYCSGAYVTISSVRFVDSGSGAPLTVSAQTLDGGSSGAVFAGGMVGYIQTDSAQYIRYKAGDFSSAENEYYTFDADVSVSATQNGVGPAYAGGLFGYNAFDITNSGSSALHFHLTDGSHDFSVLAEQSALSVPGATQTVDGAEKGTVLYDVCAGLYSSRLQRGYSVSDFSLYADNADVTAMREAGSAATGDIAAGGFAGKASGGSMSNVSMEFGSSVSVNALGYSYDSVFVHRFKSGDGGNYYDDYTSYGTGNNVYAGGFIGYLESCSLNGITVDYGAESGFGSAQYAVRGVQNAVSGNADYFTEGYVGGVFGMLANGNATGLNFAGAPGGSLIYFTSSNNPNTASVGGLIGATRSGIGADSDNNMPENVEGSNGWGPLGGSRDGQYYANPSPGFVSYGSGPLVGYIGYSIGGGTVTNAHVVGRAYCEAQDDNHPYDIYVGGAIGVFGSESGIAANVSEIYVSGTVVEAIGEREMLTYAGGLFGGIWYSGTLSASDCAVIDSSVTASSVSDRAFAAGVTGLLQSGSLTACHVIDTSVYARADSDTAYVAGVCSQIKGNLTVENCYSNAWLSAWNDTNVYIGGIGTDDDNERYSGTNYYVYENAGESEGFSNSRGGTATAIYLYGNDVNSYQNSLFLATGGTEDIFPGVPQTEDAQGVKNIVSSDPKIVAIGERVEEGSGWWEEDSYYNVATAGSAPGTAYVSVTVTLANGETYALCSYPVIVGDGTSVSDFGLGVYDADSYQTEEGAVNVPIDSETADGYATYPADEDGTPERNYTYVLVNSGSDRVQNLLVAPSGTLSDNTLLTCFPSLAAVYDASNVTRRAGETDEAYIGRIIGACQNTVVPSSFNGRVTLSFAGEAGSQTNFTLTPSPTLAERTVIVVCYTVNGAEYGVIAEFNPNEIEAVSIQPSEDTPAMDEYEQNGAIYYVYAPGDTVRFDAVIDYVYDNRNSYMVEVKFSGDSGIVFANGTVKIPGDALNEQTYKTYTIQCRLLGDGDAVVRASAVIVVRSEISVTYRLSGANVTADRKAVSNTEYTFTATPQAGYGLAPSVVINGTALTGIQAGVVDGTAIWSGYSISYTCNKSTGAYTFTLSGGTDGIMAAVTSLDIRITFEKVYNIVFIPNYTGGNASDDVFTVTVVAGAQLSEPAGLDAFIAELENSRYGFDLNGFYLASEANSSAAYGSSFEELLEGNMTVNGPIMFYARWSYNVLVEAPEGVTVSSGFGSSLVSPDGVVPIDDRHGFSVEINTPSGWAGETRFSAFIRTESGAYVDINDEFSGGTDGWSVSAERLSELAGENASGVLYIRVYSDSLTLWQGDGTAQEIDSVRSDGVYTVEYAANYRNGKTPGDITLSFMQILTDSAQDLLLPAGTSLRLYYSQNGAAVWAGSYTVPAGGASEIALAGTAFAPVAGFGEFPSRAGITSEAFYVVVTLPDNAVNFEAQLAGAASFASTVAVSAAEPDGNLEGYNLEGYGSAAGELAGDSFLKRPAVSAAEKQLQYYKADVRGVSRTETQNGQGIELDLTYRLTAGGGENAPEDVRHANLRYVWEIRRADGGAIGNVSLSGADGLPKNALLQSGSAVYFAAAEGAAELLSLDGTDYVVSLLAVRNTQYPGAGTALWSWTWTGTP